MRQEAVQGQNPRSKHSNEFHLKSNFNRGDPKGKNKILYVPYKNILNTK